MTTFLLGVLLIAEIMQVERLSLRLGTYRIGDIAPELRLRLRDLEVFDGQSHLPPRQPPIAYRGLAVWRRLPRA